MFCNYCGNKINSKAKFCNKCGQIVLDQHRRTSGNKRLKTVFFSLLGFSVLLFVVLVVIILTDMGSNNDGTSILERVEREESLVTVDLSFPETNLEIETKNEKSNNSYEINKMILGSWERTFDNVYFGYEFYDDGTLRCIEDYDNGKTLDEVITYEFINEGQMVLNGNTEKVYDVTVDYDFGQYYLSYSSGGEVTALNKVEELTYK